MVEYREIAPSPALRPYVECYWTVRARQDCPAYPVLPDGCADLLFSGGPQLELVGSMTAARHFSLACGSEMFGVRFRPAMAGLFVRASWEELVDGNIAADGSKPLADQLQQHHGRVEAVERWLRLVRNPGPVQSIAGWIESGAGPATMDDLSRLAGLSTRQLRRVFLAETGLTPKYLCRVLRFRRAVQRMAETPRPDFAALALDTGYYDQAHMINEFRHFSGGHTPAAWQARMADFSNPV